MSERLDTGYASLSESDGVYTVHGVALGEDDVTNGGSGKKTLWPRETLEAAANDLEGQPLATDVDHTADSPQGQTPVEALVGRVTWSGYKPGVGVLYEAELSDESLADKVKNGWLEVSPLVSREIEPLTDSDEADYVATKINRWRDLATVAKGAAPSNEITMGKQTMKAEALHAVVESLQDGDIERVPPDEARENAAQVLEWREEHGDDVDAMTETGWRRARQLADGEELSDDVIKKMAQFNRHRSNAEVADEHEGEPWKDNGHVAWLGWGGDAGVEWAIRKSEKMESMSAEALKEVAGVEFDGTADGKLDEGDISTDDGEFESHYLYPADTKSDSSYPVVDADGNLRRGNVESAWQLGARGGVDEEDHKRRLRELAQEFDNPPEWATEEGTESMADIDDVSEGTLVTWGSSGDRNAYGEVVDIREEGDDPLDDEIDGDQTIEPPAALIEVHQPTEDGWDATDTMVGHKLNTDTLEVIDDLPDPESLAKHEESLDSLPDEYQFDNPGEAVAKAQDMGFEGSGDEIIHTHGDGDDTVFMPGPTHEDLVDEIEGGDTQSDDETQESMSQSSVAGENSEETMTDELTDDEKAILEAAEGVDNAAEALNEYAATEEPTIVAQTDYEAMQANIDSVRGVMEDALCKRTDLKESTVEALSFEALRSEFETEDGDLDAEALVQTPETGQPEEGEEALSEDADVDTAEALYGDYEAMTNPPQGLKNDIVEALGVSDFDEAIEVLN